MIQRVIYGSLRREIWHTYTPRYIRHISNTNFLRSKLPPPEFVLPQFNFPAATHSIQAITSNLDSYLDNKDVIVLHGHLNRTPRIRSKISFAELRDVSGDTVQLILMPDRTPPEYFDILSKTSTEDSICVSGTVQLKKLVAGELRKWELVITSIQLLNLANEEAARLDKLKHSDPNKLPPHYRFLQLRTKELQKNLRTRSIMAAVVRHVLGEKHNFTEIETPLLFKSTPEGAREFLVPTRSPNKFYALPQSPQQYKQILMSSGFTRYYQLAKCFRDEDLRADRQPEFTQVDLEMSFISHSDQVLCVVEDVIYGICNNVASKPVYTLNEDGYIIEAQKNGTSPSFYKLSYKSALEKYGIDKPDLRSSLQFVNLSSYFKPVNCPDEFNIIEACILKGALAKCAHCDIPDSLTNPENYSRRAPSIIPITNSSATTWFETLTKDGVMVPVDSFDPQKLNELLGLEEGDIIAISNRSEHPYENPTPLGRFRNLAMAEYPDKWKRKLIDSSGNTSVPPSDAFVSCWVHDFPLFSPSEENSGSNDLYPKYNWDHRESTHHPFTMVKSEDYSLLESDPYLAHGEHYDLVINGVEVGGGSRRIHNPLVQQYVLEEVLKIKNYNSLFGHLLEALSFGCPPHAGLALGFDRLCAMVVGTQSIRDVIAFPKNQSGVDPVVSSPSNVDSETLADYYIQTID